MDQDIFSSGLRCFPVMNDGTLDGSLTLHQIKSVPRERWVTTRVKDIALDRTALKTGGPDDVLTVVLDRMTSEDINQFPVRVGDQFSGGGGSSRPCVQFHPYAVGAHNMNNC